MSAASALLLAIMLAACSGDEAATKPSPATKVPAATKAPAAPPARPGFAKRRALIAQGKAAFGTGDWDTCARLFEAAHSWADAARCAGHTRDADRGFDDVRRALAHNPRELDKLRDDADLIALRRDRRWQPLISEATSKLAAYRSTVNVELEQLARITAPRRAPGDGGEPAGGPPVEPTLEPAASAAVFSARRARVAEILAAGGAKIADDYLHAAVVYYRADTGEDAVRSHDLALTALERDPESDDAKWLVAATEDRRLRHAGKPQKYGTQFVISQGNRVLWNIDPSVSDSERERWSVPSLAEAIAGDAETTAAARVGEPQR